MKLRAGPSVFEVEADWAKRPASLTWTEVAAVAVDSKERVFVFNRGPSPIAIFERDGRFVGTWGDWRFVGIHGITIGPDDAVYCTDHAGHTVEKFGADGRHIMTLGTRGQPSDTGATTVDCRTVRRSAGPFNFPTSVALSAAGEIYVADGYGNARVHKFSPDGRLLLSWGEPGGGPGQFRLAHGIAVGPREEVVVADRENNRVQFFDPDGRFLRQWGDLARPNGVAFDGEGNLFVGELGFRAGMLAGMEAPAGASGGRLTIFDRRGAVLARWGGGAHPTDPGDFFAPHQVCVDRHGDLYVAEVVATGGGNYGLVSLDCHSLQKFRRVEAAASPLR